MLLDVLLPSRCAACELPGPTFCDNCRDALVRLAPPLCARCGSPGAWPVLRCAECSGRRLGFAAARAAVVYDETARRLVHAWKERGQRRLARTAAELTAETLSRPQADALAFVPSDGERALERGHRPAESLARELGRAWGLPVEGLLRRTRPVDRQRSLPLRERQGNVAGAFAATEQPVPAAVCLVDDVYTSGSTAASAARALRRAGAGRVEVVTFARTVR